ncbi:MAG TPA: hypothetical protein VKW78_07820 [Terriglobales bacterium]|nr:hypothetical protein [Terriglobales bacterium]
MPNRRDDGYAARAHTQTGNPMASFCFSFFCLSLALAVFLMPGSVFWPYFAGMAILDVGLAVKVKKGSQRVKRLDRIVQFGPVFVAIAMAIFGADHLTAAKFVAMIVPSWMPGKLFWAYFVGFALLAAALSLVTGVKQRLAASLLGSMIFIFVLTIHIPVLAGHPFDSTRLTILLRDTLLSASILAFAASDSWSTAQSSEGVFSSVTRSIRPKVVSAARFIVAGVMSAFAVSHFIHPMFAPGIPQENVAFFVTMPSWIPGHAFWAYLVGTIFLGCAVGLLLPKRARLASVVLGLTFLTLTLVVYLPLTISKAADIADGLNYLAIHFAFAGAALMLAAGLPASSSLAESIGEKRGNEPSHAEAVVTLQSSATNRKGATGRTAWIVRRISKNHSHSCRA